MANEPMKDDVSLQELLEEAIGHKRELREAHFAATREALKQAKEVMDRRLDGMNEMRAQINREHGLFVSRELFDRMLSIIEERIRSLENSRSNWEGRIWMIGGVFVLVQIVLAVLTFVMKR